MIASLILAAVSIAMLVVLIRYLRRRREALIRALLDMGFKDVIEEGGHRIDLTVTLQWPEGKGIRYLLCFAKPERDYVIKVAGVECPPARAVRRPMRFDSSEQTFVSFELYHGELPRFHLCPGRGRWFELLVIGGQRFFSGDQVFDRNFFVVTPDAAPLSSFFSPAKRAELLKHPRVFIEAGKRSLIIYRHDQVPKPRELKRLVALGRKLVAGLHVAGTVIGRG